MHAVRNSALAVFVISVCLAQRPASAVIIAADDASQTAYNNGWQAGDNGGTGLGSWTLAYSGVLTGLFHDPRFIDRAPLSGNSLGAPSFALTTGDRVFESDTSEAARTFTAPIAVGQTFSMDVDGSALNPSALKFSTGNTIQLLGPGAQNERFALYTNNDHLNNTWVATGEVSTGIPAASAFHLAFTLATPNTYNLVLSPVAGGTPFFTRTGAALTGTSGSDINSIRISTYSTGSSADGTKELFFDNLTLSAPGIAGDYNNNARVDAADFVVWRETLNRTGTGLPADGNGDGRVDASDYSMWRRNFDPAPGAAIGAVATVPEPATSLMIVAAAACFLTAFARVCRVARLS